ncbi:tryptophan--tRNA ligase [candidate division WWE3 bacterium CG09_land_8_20_14_0_10_39_24]|uniref:Tryptophan--tRNA ligase n=2 Tax=Katanobacteria TaxID=422282 RepID=A0A2G9XC35_UNCKA|nr:MAG: tryptophan--tRNA ligase [bacterium CG2_30_40_12]OJI09322.1 MAG: tryptophan--tRNA ligase [bacterium CG09_39_24]PIP04526.1 MAG: tryptophan--tRNA ligase [candidate division WWE3 bacterium CG23_combo_of_CG06-09_8_20_14_all_40_14]PIS13026.1 MAG: tryptophan--tRNA ligase [candidate division WWE3 bacterium CG09_land_8_20_14_0_10_39_24]PJE51808.1 MAG: tryptophan--tRNA ligase [candidate division WWE3 bacterium CG10_big_fil_rev_8_21_14_0_10_39_14]
MKKRILTGDRPTGKLHLGHFAGSLKNRVELQDKYEQFIIVADVQALTDNFKTPEKVSQSVCEVVMDNLAVGLDPEKSTIFIQSGIPQIAELTVFFANLVTVSRLSRNPTVKAEIGEKNFGTSVPLGFFMYPVSQAADILFLNADLVPVGDDQLPHIEQTREIARSFNNIYGTVFNIPQALVGECPRLVGIYGNAKMSKSLGNCIYLSDSKEDLKKKVMKMFTDPNRIHSTDPGETESNPVFVYHRMFNPNKGEVTELAERYKKGAVGDIEVKEKLFFALNDFLEPIREKRRYYEERPNLVKEIINEGTKKARKEAEITMSRVKEAMGINYYGGNC